MNSNNVVANMQTHEEKNTLTLNNYRNPFTCMRRRLMTIIVHAQYSLMSLEP